MSGICRLFACNCWIELVIGGVIVNPSPHFPCVAQKCSWTEIWLWTACASLTRSKAVGTFSAGLEAQFERLESNCGRENEVKSVRKWLRSKFRSELRFICWNCSLTWKEKECILDFLHKETSCTLWLFYGIFVPVCVSICVCFDVQCNAQSHHPAYQHLCAAP